MRLENVAGLAFNGQNDETAKATPIATAFKNCVLAAEKWASESHQARSSFPQF
jgi:hypothetical protein